MPNEAERVLVASPSPVLRQRTLESLPSPASYVEQASGGAEALAHLENGFWNVLFLDRRLPDLDAEELQQTVRERYPSVEVVLMDREDGSDLAARAPDAEESAEVRLEWRDEAAETCGDLEPGEGRGWGGSGEWEQGGTALSGRVATGAYVGLPGMIGNSAAMQAVSRMVRLVAPRETTVLITGPTGSGKELVARAVHELSRRADRPFAVVNCAAIPETLLEAELFGYARGAFTGAMQAYGGRIQAAHTGTLFLDEIGEMPLSLQPKLLRFLEQKELQRLGSSQVVRVDTRIVAATNVDLLALAGQGKFREDLYYRLSAFPLSIAPLKNRPGDVEQLAAYFLGQFCGGPPAPVLSEEASALLRAQSWPGNVRELQNVIERALILAEGGRVIHPRHLTLGEGGFRARTGADRTPSSGVTMSAF